MAYDPQRSGLLGTLGGDLALGQRQRSYEERMLREQTLNTWYERPKKADVTNHKPKNIHEQLKAETDEWLKSIDL